MSSRASKKSAPSRSRACRPISMFWRNKALSRQAGRGSFCKITSAADRPGAPSRSRPAPRR
jgi:hypothetical protein